MKELYEKYIGDKNFGLGAGGTMEKSTLKPKGKYYVGNYKPIAQAFAQIYDQADRIINLASDSKLIQKDIKKISKQLDVLADKINKDNF